MLAAGHEGLAAASIDLATLATDTMAIVTVAAMTGLVRFLGMTVLALRVMYTATTASHLIRVLGFADY